MEQDIRWKQRLRNFKLALNKLSEAIDLLSDENNFQNIAIKNIAKAGLIQYFEFTMELSWNVMKDYLTENNVKNILGSKDAIRNAFAHGLIEDGQIWFDMLLDRNLLSHTYNEETADDLVEDIISNYHSLFVKFSQKMESLL